MRAFKIFLNKWFVFLAMGLPSMCVAQFVNPLHIPDTISGTEFKLTVDESSVQFLAGEKTATFGINADYLAPTIIMRKGDFVQMHVTNMLSDTTTMHWHGMHVAPEDDGGPHTAINPGETWSPDFEVLDEATTFWYHPHLHHKTAQQVYSGAAGMLIVKDEAEAKLDLPRTYGVDDFPMIVQDKSFDENNQLIFTAMADSMMVNGTLAPYLEVPAQRVRFRFLNASNQRVYNISFPRYVDPTIIGTDGGLLERPAPIPDIILSPGERIEMIADFTGYKDSVLRITCNNSDLPDGVSGGPGGLRGRDGNRLDSNDFDLMELRVISPTANPAGSIPNKLNDLHIWDVADADTVRVKVFDAHESGFPYYINGTPFNHMVVNDTVYLDAIEIWEIRNTTNIAHPFHIHDVQFYIISINGDKPPAPLSGRKDVVLLNVDDTVRFITKFEDFTDKHIPYMYHCHNLFHEDAGMMGQFLVLEDPSSVPEKEGRYKPYSLFPNPSNGVFTLDVGSGSEILEIRVYNQLGVLVKASMKTTVHQSTEIDLSAFPTGHYFIHIIGPDKGGEVLKAAKI